ncbi:MAG: Uma2 family endonuclease [Candidatus Kapaibacterium sp.]|nr:MAG: Uma2 family endonuclease [Candidatus Kapabacteria bacterium]
MSAIPQRLFSEEEYRRREEMSPFKSEYYRGEIFAMAGGTPRHAEITMSFGAALKRKKPRQCRVYSGDAQIHIPQNTLYTYPDVSVVCGKPEIVNNALCNPILIVEVLSPSTRNYDRNEKRLLYAEIPTLKEYVVVEQDEERVDVWRKDSSGAWVFLPMLDGAASIHLDSLNCDINLDEIYERFELDGE